MATTDFSPRFFKVFVSQFSSDAMLIPIAYYDQLPRVLPKTTILQGPGGRSWNVAMKMKQDEVYFEQGWSQFVEDNTMTDGDFLTFVYDGDRIFEVSIYRRDGDKETREATEVEKDKEQSVYSLSGDGDSGTCSKSATKNTIPKCRDKGKSKVEVVKDSDDKEASAYSLSSEETDTDTCSEFKMGKTIPKRQNKNKGKKKKEVVESLSSEETDTCSEFKMGKTIPKKRNKNNGRKKKEVVESSDEDSDSDSDYTEGEADDPLDSEENSNSDNSYSPNNEDTATCVKPKVPNLKRKEAAKKRKKVEPKIKNPETYLDNPKNIYFETNVKNRLYELLVHAQLVKDYCLNFGDHIDYIDRFGPLRAKTAKWKDQRVCIKRWMRICSRNALKKEDRVLCELMRKQNFVYAIKLHIIRGRNL